MTSRRAAALLAACAVVVLGLSVSPACASSPAGYTHVSSELRFETAWDASALITQIKPSNLSACATSCDTAAGCTAFFIWLDDDSVTRCRLLNRASPLAEDLVATARVDSSYVRDSPANFALSARGLNGQGLRFINAFHDGGELFKTTEGTDSCIQRCRTNDACAGIFSYIAPASSLWRCVGLAEVQYPLVNTSLTSFSYAKIDFAAPPGFLVAARGANLEYPGTPRRFAEAFQPASTIRSVTDITLEQCATLCLAEDTCEGVYHFRLGSAWRCRLLKDLSGETVKTAHPSYSLKRDAAETLVVGADVTYLTQTAFEADNTLFIEDNLDRLIVFPGVVIDNFDLGVGGLYAVIRANGVANGLYSVPGGAVSTNNSGDALDVTFITKINGVAMDLYLKNVDNNVVSGLITVTCGDFSTTFYSHADSSSRFFGLAVFSPACTFQAADPDTYPTIDNVRLGFSDFCSDISANRTFCWDEPSFRGRLSGTMVGRISGLTLPATQIVFSAPEYPLSATVDSETCTNGNCTEIELVYTPSGNGITAGSSLARSLDIHFSAGVGGFGGLFYASSSSREHVPSTLTLTCDGIELFHYTQTHGVQAFYTSSSGFFDCALTTNVGTPAILSLKFGKATPCESTDLVSTKCSTFESLSQNIEVVHSSNFDGLGEPGTYIVGHTENGIQANAGADCSSNCFEVLEGKAIRAARNFMRVTFATPISIFGANIYTRGLPGNITISCGDSFRSIFLTANTNSFFTCSSDSVFDEVLLDSQFGADLIVDNVVGGNLPECNAFNSFTQASYVICRDLTAFRGRTLVNFAKDFSSFTPNEPFSQLYFGGGNHMAIINRAGCGDCLTVTDGPQALTPTSPNDFLSLSFYFLASFGGHFYSLASDRESIVPARWNLVCNNGDVTLSGYASDASAFFGVVVDNLYNCILFSDLNDGFMAIDNLDVGRP